MTLPAAMVAVVMASGLVAAALAGTVSRIDVVAANRDAVESELALAAAEAGGRMAVARGEVRLGWPGSMPVPAAGLGREWGMTVSVLPTAVDTIWLLRITATGRSDPEKVVARRRATLLLAGNTADTAVVMDDRE